MRFMILMAVACISLLSPRLLAAQTDGNNWIGGYLSVALPPVGFADPYSGPLGLGLYYERHRILGGLALGGLVACHGFYPLRTDFGGSYMLVGGLKAGYEVRFRIERRFALSLSPYLSARYYWRRFDFQDVSFSARRPMLAAGADLDLLIRSHSLLGVNLELLFILDDAFRLTAAQSQRIGVRF